MSSTSGNGSTLFNFGGQGILPMPASRTDLNPASYTSKMVGGKVFMIGCSNNRRKRKSSKRIKPTKKRNRKMRKTSKRS